MDEKGVDGDRLPWDDPNARPLDDIRDASERAYEQGLRASGGFVVPEIYLKHVMMPLTELPTFTAVREGIEFNLEPGTPPSRWQKRRWRLRARVRAARRRIALRIDPSLEYDPWEDW